ncbi:MAG: S9 family peptidase, partial [Caulobacteraceae bacterium]|nr:S9 family peptidase [Caulobacter sp.]
MSARVPGAPVAPKAERRPLSIEQLGRTRVDPYAWLKDPNWKAVMRDPAALAPDIRAHLEAENAYTQAVLAPTDALQAQMFAEMRGRIKEDDSSLPSPDGPWAYSVRYREGDQHPLHVRTPRDGGDEQVLLDEPALAQGKAFFSVASGQHSPDHALYAYAVDEQGSEYFEIRLIDLASGATRPQVIESTTGDFCWSPDGRWLFWVWRDENARPAKVFRRPRDGGEDVLVYEEPDAGFFVHIGVTQSRGYIVVSSGDHETSESRLVPASDPTASPRVVEPRTPGLRYSVEHWPTEGDPERLVVLTNADGAIDYKIMWADARSPGRAGWREWIAHEPGRYITGVAALRDNLVRGERVDANDRIVVTARADLSEHALAFEEEAYTLSFSIGFEWASPTITVVYQSPTTPRSWFDYDLATRGRTLRKVQEVPSGHDPQRYVARRLHAPAVDGACVPITVLMRRDTPLDGSAPMLLYGYGAYGIAMEPSFSIRNFSLVDRGWIWATAHVRGGSEKGWGWFLDGRKAHKTNTFTDFTACAEHLHAQGYGAAGRTVAYGGSAGGMLMGAVANLRPDLWAGVIGAVPFVDVLNTMSDASLPLTPPEWPEWGDPLHDAQAYDCIAGYSPYDNVAALPYPAILATGGLSDPRVTY